MISQDSLPEGLVARCLDVLRVLSPNERDLIRVVVEVVHELRDDGEPEKEEEAVRPILSYFPHPLTLYFHCARWTKPKKRRRPATLQRRRNPQGPLSPAQISPRKTRRAWR
jgi:hypothetical protein